MSVDDRASATGPRRADERDCERALRHVDDVNTGSATSTVATEAGADTTSAAVVRNAAGDYTVMFTGTYDAAIGQPGRSPPDRAETTSPIRPP